MHPLAGFDTCSDKAGRSKEEGRGLNERAAALRSGANKRPLHTKHRQLASTSVEIEIGVLKGQCLDRRIESCDRLIAEIDVWQSQRNQTGARITWMFSTDKARTKMARAYPNPSLKES